MEHLSKKALTLFMLTFIISMVLYSISMKYHDNITKLLSPNGNTQIYKQEGGVKARKGYLTATLIGGLGNQMFIYASLYGLAKKSHRIPIACTRYNISMLFPNLSIPIYPREHCKKGVDFGKLPKRTKGVGQQHGAHFFDPQLLQKIKMSNDSRVHLGGYLQNTGFFVEYMDELKRDFSLSYIQQDNAYSYLNGQIELYKKHNSIHDALQIVGVHVRRGDLAKVPGMNVPNEAYFKKAMKYFRKKYQNKVFFVVSSDDPKWCHQFIKGKDVVFTADTGEKSREEDFSIQVCCNHTIVSFGTFGWWMGFLTNGEVTVFKDWAGTSRAEKWYHPEQRYPLDWKLM